MSNERRQHRRYTINRIAKFQTDAGALPRDCMITDISDGGVKFVAEHLVPPPEFTLIFSTGSPKQCRLVWQIGCEFGAEFVR